VLLRLHVPIPGIHDEFSYLLASDTFAHGRLTNPPHPMWVSFETFHVNWLPTYCSKYPPAQGLFLALGQVLGHPWIGVLLSMAAMCTAILWMLQGWVPARWAFLGAALVELKLGITSYWVNSYWGGAVAGIGGALVLGSLARIAKRPRVRYAIVLAVGTAILANSRPYEGLLFCLPCAAWLFWWFIGRIKSKATLRDRFVKVIAPTAAVLVVAGACMGYYNWRLTGSPLLMPYTVNSRMYTSSGLFLWDRPKAPKHYRNQQLEDFYINFERDNYHNNLADVLRVSGEKLIRGGLTYFFSGLLLTLPALPFALRDTRMGLPLATIAVSAIAVFVVIWSHAHYAAAITGALYLVIVQAIRHLRLMFSKVLPVGAALSRAIVIVLAAAFAIRLAGLAEAMSAGPSSTKNSSTRPVSTSSSCVTTKKTTTSMTNGSSTALKSTTQKSYGPASLAPNKTPSSSPTSRTAKSGSSLPTPTTPTSSPILRPM
jgi:hypothetical protein